MMEDAPLRIAPTFAYSEAACDAADALRDLGIAVSPDAEARIKNALVSPVRALMIQDEYSRGRKAGLKSEYLQAALAERFCLSYAAVHKIIFQNEGGKQ